MFAFPDAVVDPAFKGVPIPAVPPPPEYWKRSDGLTLPEYACVWPESVAVWLCVWLCPPEVALNV